MRPELIEVRDQLQEKQAEIRAQHDLGVPAVQVCAKLTSAVDHAVQKLFELALVDMNDSGGAANEQFDLRKKCALVAHGGYGRRQMAPCSDIDLMVLYENDAEEAGAEINRRIIKDVSDLRMQIGPSLRSVDEALHYAKTDTVVCTSLIESRLLVGDSALYERFATAFEKMVQRRSKTLCPAFIEARREEREKFGETVYLLEPNIKKSRGGLRDIHLLRWLWFAHSGVSDIDRLRMKGVLSKFDHHRLVSARDFLLKTRNEAHFAAGKQRDLLDRVEQVRLAEKLGYRGREGMHPVEQFMQDYFRYAGHIWFLAARVSELSTPRNTMSTVLNAVFGRSIEKDYHLDAREITANKGARVKLQTKLDEAMRLVDLARLSGSRISQDTWYLVYRSAPNYSTDLEHSTTERFLTVLENPKELGDLLRRMHDLGILEKIIPEYAHARCLLQMNHMHKFTVDEHCIRTVEEATEFADRKDRLGEVYRDCPNKQLLHLALLIHDLGKGHERDHSEIGAEIAERTGPRLRLSEADTRQLAFLVRRHLWMSHMALRYDLNDTEMVAQFAAEVGSRETLTLLYLLTCADMAGVSPDVLSGWKVEMLTELYERAFAQFSPDESLAIERRREAMRDAAWKLLPAAERDDPWLRKQFAKLPHNFITSRPPAAVVDLLRRLKALDENEGAAWGEPHDKLGTIEMLAAVNHGVGRGIFSSMAGALSAANMQIVAAETAVLEDEMLVLRFVAEDATVNRLAIDQRVEDLAKRMVASIDSQEPPKFPHIWGADQHQRKSNLVAAKNEVRIDADLSDESLILEIYAVDRLGLLYLLSREVHELSLVIRTAKITTSATRIVDVFYVTEPDGAKPAGEDRHNEIRERLLARLNDTH